MIGKNYPLMQVARRGWDIKVHMTGSDVRLIRTRNKEETNIYKDRKIVSEPETPIVIKGAIKIPDGALRLNNDTSHFADLLPIEGWFKFTDNVRIDDIIEIDYMFDNELPRPTIQWLPKSGSIIGTVDPMNYETGCPVLFTAENGNRVSPLELDKLYYLHRVDSSNYKLCTTEEDAIEGLGFVEFTDQGSSLLIMHIQPRIHTYQLRVINIEPTYWKNEINGQVHTLTIHRDNN